MTPYDNLTPEEQLKVREAAYRTLCVDILNVLENIHTEDKVAAERIQALLWRLNGFREWLFPERLQS